MKVRFERKIFKTAEKKATCSQAMKQKLIIKSTANCEQRMARVPKLTKTARNMNCCKMKIL